MGTAMGSTARKLESIVMNYQWALLLFIVILGLFLRVSGVFSVSIFHDEGKFLYKTSDILRGAVLNRDFGDASLYGIFVFTTFCFSVFGESFFLTRLFFSSVNIVAVLLVYLTARELCGEKVGLLSALLFAVEPSVVAWSRLVMADPIMTLFALFGLYMFLVAEKKNSRLGLFWSGVSLGVALLTKPVGILMFLIISLYILAKDSSRRRSLRGGLTRIACLLLGLVPPLCIFICYVVATNSLNGLWLFNNFFFRFFPSPQYGSGGSVSWIGETLWERVVHFVNAAKYSQVTWLCGAAGAIYVGCRKGFSHLLVLWVLVFIVPFLFLTAALSHYTYFVMPSLTTLSAVLILEGTSKLRFVSLRKSNLSKRRILILCSIAVLLAYAAYRISYDNMVLASELPEDFTPTKIPPLELQMRVGEYLKAHTSSDERAYVWTLTYAFVADRSAVSNALGNPANEFPHPSEIISQLEEKRVRYGILDFQARLYLDTPYWEELGEYIRSEFVIEEIVGSEVSQSLSPGPVDVFVYRSLDSIPQTVRFEEHFDELGSTGNWNIAEGTWTVADGEYEAVGVGVSYVKDFTASRFILEAKQRMANYSETTANWLGFLFAKQSMNESFSEGYLIKFRYDGIIEICRNGSSLELVQTNLCPTAYVTVRLVVFGYDIKVYVNDVLYLDIVEAACPDGYIALVSNASHGYFDDVIVKTPGNWPSTHTFGKASSVIYYLCDSEVYLCATNIVEPNLDRVYVDPVMRKRK